ncbi:DUF4129 domain-containing protein [Pseudomonas sp. RA_35y_Pfl2_P32]|uniref:DUF4129 domain-containing protein n=1 Tax=Pseudomonas sp. RA_35y_Pfl2_P32 TaxID=3088705 RepID=UPI0030DA4712
MRLNDASVVIRPRTTWEAMDLGILLSQRHRRVLMSSWALVTLPVFALLSVLLWDSPALALGLFWWLKPAFERLTLYILSNALFGQAPTVQQALRQWPRLLKPQLLASLTWRRLSLSRSFTLPVVQLEGLGGVARQQRLAVLQQRDAGAARWLTLIGVLLESVLWIGSMSLFYLFLPGQIELDWDWQTLIASSAQDWLWLEHLTNALYVLILIVWEPVYVACGFSLYLNRRTTLEAWDIELVFRRLRQRLSTVVASLLLLGLLGLPAAQPVLAAESSAAPASPRLLQQPLNSQASSTAIHAILDAPPFKNTQTLTRYRLGDAEPEQPQAGQAPGWLKALFELLDSPHLAGLASIIEVLLWTTVIGLLALLAWHYREWLQTFVSRRPALPRSAQRPLPAQMFGLDLGRESLPDDVAAEVERLWASRPREALGLLYRALLVRLLHDYALPLTSADTEGQVLGHIQRLQQPQLHAFSSILTKHWQNIAYGHRVPPPALQAQLCAGWRALFDRGVGQ